MSIDFTNSELGLISMAVNSLAIKNERDAQFAKDMGGSNESFQRNVENYRGIAEKIARHRNQETSS